MQVIDKLLIANRGEIACRIIRTARRMGIETVAVYSQADASALHVRMADEAFMIGPASAAESYLKIEAVVQAACQSGADAIHPGYGFLAESGAFASAVRDAGLIFVGPPSEAIEAMGAKDNAKALMAEAGVPLVPGYYGGDQSVERLAAEAENVGYPVLLKPALGGGGKGMRVVQSDADLPPALEGAKREALSSFGDARMLIEKYLTATRHVEVQVFADAHGNAVHLFERDCSLQRRHQKVIEEAPAPAMTEELRGQMGASAVAAAKAVDYAGAGTVEFLLTPDQQYYFMEMNTRLQVEHPVSEMITGLDFVEWQIRIARGEPLPLQQDQISFTGHAVEARVYAEDPDRDFMPSPGTVDHLRWPPETGHLRIDAGVEAGDVVSPHYDPMIAKVISYGPTREQAVAQLVAELAKTEIVGPGHNIGFLISLLKSSPFQQGKADTGFVDQLPPDALALSAHGKQLAFAAAAWHLFDAWEDQHVLEAGRSTDPHSPWASSSGWRLGGWQPRQVKLGLAGEWLEVTETAPGARPSVILAGEQISPPSASAARVVESGGQIHVFGPDGPLVLDVFDPLQAASAAAGAANPFIAPMPGKITALHVSEGDRVTAGDVLVVLEAMKMEHSIAAPTNGTIGSVFVSPGQQIEEGLELLTMEPEV